MIKGIFNLIFFGVCRTKFYANKFLITFGIDFEILKLEKTKI